MRRIKTYLCFLLTLTYLGNAHKQIKEPRNHRHQQTGDAIQLLLSHDDPLCAEWSGDTCVRCSPRSYFNSQKKCIEVNPYCQKFNEKRAQCMKCYEGYQLLNGDCVITGGTELKFKDPLCAQWNKQVCLKCSPRSYMNREGLCFQVDPNCNQYSQSNGECLTCFVGFKLRFGRCLVQNLNEVYRANPLCTQWKDSTCIKCSVKTFKNENTGKCTAVNPACNTYNEKNGECLSCYQGYGLIKGDCVTGVRLENKNNNPLCSQWRSGQCVTCSSRSYFNNQKICTQIDPNCKTYDQKIGTCFSCYDGYQLSADKCTIKQQIQGPAQSTIQNNPLCSVWKGQVCDKCSPRSYFDEKMKCKEVDPFCKQFDYGNKLCLSCYIGYKLSSDKQKCFAPGLQPSNQREPGETECVSRSNNNKCVACSPGSALTANNKCKLYDSNCKNFNGQEWYCQECFQSFIPIGQKCLPYIQNENFDAFRCKDWNNGRCVQCFSCFELKENGLCYCPNSSIV